ncbi:hypothetical protein RHOW815_000466 [Candidatus Rhabdochlamydia sp. W815]|nr:hypothetical protein RHOW815_000466 [Candidatus Rhabdochlamydia sp. W815]
MGRKVSFCTKELFQNQEIKKPLYKIMPLKIRKGMMKIEKAKSLDNEKFRRLTGLKRSTFDQMSLILEDKSQREKSPRRPRQ